MRSWLASAVALAAAILATDAASAADAPTAKSLLGEGYTVVGAIQSTIGPGVFLEKGDSVYLCFVAETVNSPSVKTRYCKPVE